MEGSDALARVARLFKIITLVTSQTAGRSLGREQLAEACECSPRTIQRDTDLLQEAGIPLTYDAGQRAYVLPERGWTFPIAPLTSEDVLSLALLQEIIGMPGFPQPRELQATLRRLTAGIPSGLADLMREASQALRLGSSTRDYSRAPIQGLIAAASARQTVEIDYLSRSGRGRSWRRVEPYVVDAREGRFWELHGWCPRNNAIRTFALDQVLEMRLTGETFVVREPDWTLFAGAQGIVGGVRSGLSVAIDVLFLPEVALYARDRHWPDGLVLTLQDDGTARLQGQVQGVAGIVPELLRWRRFCRVDGGPELRTKIIEELNAMADLYL